MPELTLEQMAATPYRVDTSPTSALSTDDEEKFQSWYSSYATNNRLNPNPDDPRHFYDYRGFWKKYQPDVTFRGFETEHPKAEGKYRLPDEFKLVGHPVPPITTPSLSLDEMANVHKTDEGIYSTAKSFVDRFGMQLWNTAVATPAHVLSRGGDPAEIEAWQAQEKRIAKRKEPLSPELLDDEFTDIVRQLRQYPTGARDDDDLQNLPQYPKITERPVLGLEVAPAAGLPEKIVDVGAGLAGFIAQLAIARQVLPAGTPTPVIWETVNLSTGGQPGQGAAMAATLGMTGQIPAVTKLGKAARMVAESGIFGGLEAAAGGTPEDIAIQALIPPTLRGIGYAKTIPARMRAVRPPPEITPTMPAVEKPPVTAPPEGVIPAVPEVRLPEAAPRGRVAVWAEKIYQGFVNRFASIENITKRAQKLGMTIRPGENPTLRARGYLGMGRKAESVIEDSTYRITPEGKIEITGEGLRPILKDYEQTTVEKNTPVAEQDLKDYLIARRTIQDLQRPKYEGSEDFIATPEQVKQSQTRIPELQSKYGDNIGTFDQTATRLYGYQKRVLHTLVEGGNLSEQQYREIIKRNPNYVPFDRIMDDIEGVTGVPKTKQPFTGARAPIRKIKGSQREIHDPIESVIKNTYRIMDAAERNTVARTIIGLQRAFPEEITPVRIKMRPIKIDPKEISTIIRTFRTQTRPIVEEVRETSRRTAAGEDVPVSGPMDKLKTVVKEALVHRGMTEPEAENYIRKIEQQAAGGKAPTGETIERTVRQIIRETQQTIIREQPIESTIFRPSPFKPKGNIVEYFEKGKRKYVEVTPNLYDAMSGLNETSSGLLINILSKPASWLRTGATMTPEFMIRNPIRDQQSALMQTSFGFVPFVDSGKAVADILGKTDVYYDWLRSGGAYSGFVELSRPQLEMAAKELVKGKSLLSRLNIITDAQDISQIGEQATRLAVYKKAVAAGKVPIEAGFESREATVDFGRRGSRTKEVNKVIAFFNAGIQGVDKTARTFVTHPVSATAKGIALITIPQLLLYLHNRQDPDYKEVPRWQKDLFFITKVPGTNVYARIPKGFLYGQIFGSIPERFFEYLDTKDPSAFDRLLQSTYDALLPTQGDPSSGLLATGIKPIIENITNYSFFRQAPILPEGVKELEPAEQYTRYTSETAKQVGKILGYSPAKIENLLQGYIGGTARYVTGAGDFLINKIREAAGKKVPVKPTTGITRYPGIYGLTLQPPIETGQAESVNIFYKNRDRLAALQKTFDKMVNEGRKEEARKFIQKNPQLSLTSDFASTAREMSELNKRIDMIMFSEKLTAEQKADKIHQIEKQRVALAQRTNKMLK